MHVLAANRAVSEQIYAMHKGTLKHQTRDQASHTWRQRRSPPQPNITVTISAREEDFRAHGHTLARKTHHLATIAVADTGCQSCLACPSLMSSLHLSENKLIPVSLVMHSASGTNLPILGAALLCIWVQLTDVETRQMVYFSSMATKPCNLRGPGANPKRVPLQHTDSTPGRRPGVRGNPRLAPGNTTSCLTYSGPADQTPLIGHPSHPPTHPSGTTP